MHCRFPDIASCFGSAQAVSAEPSTSEGAAHVSILERASSPIKPTEKESSAVAEEIVQSAREEELIFVETVAEGTGNVVAGDDQTSRPVLLLAPMVRAPTQGGASSSVLEIREGVSFSGLYAGMMAQFDQQ